MAFFSNYQLGTLDRIAYHALAVSYSAIYVDHPGVQQYIGQPCIAVALYQGKLLIAANNIWRIVGSGTGMYAVHEAGGNVGNTNVLTMICNAIRQEGIGNPIYFIANPLGEEDTTYHAELQLIDFVYTVNNGHFDNNIIGVSKPCCQFCANELQNLGVAITDFHNSPTNAAYGNHAGDPFAFHYC